MYGELSIPLTTPFPRGYTYATLARAQAVVVFPVEISTMTLFELYSMCIPMLVPSKRYLHQLISSSQCRNQSDYNKIKPHGINFWLDNADFYVTMPYICYFDSLKELQHLLVNTPSSTWLYQSQCMRIERTKRIEKAEKYFTGVIDWMKKYTNQI